MDFTRGDQFLYFNEWGRFHQLLHTMQTWHHGIYVDRRGDVIEHLLSIPTEHKLTETTCHGNLVLSRSKYLFCGSCGILVMVRANVFEHFSLIYTKPFEDRGHLDVTHTKSWSHAPGVSVHYRRALRIAYESLDLADRLDELYRQRGDGHAAPDAEENLHGQESGCR